MEGNARHKHKTTRALFLRQLVLQRCKTDGVRRSPQDAIQCEMGQNILWALYKEQVSQKKFDKT